MNIFRMLAICCSFLVAVQAKAQQTYELDATLQNNDTLVPLPMKGHNPQGVILSVNNRYFEKNGRPWLPVMGEFHFSRYPHRYWEQELLCSKSKRSPRALKTSG